MFKWVCYATAVLFAALITWLLFDLRSDVKASLAQADAAVATVNGNLPEIVEEVKAGTQTLARLSQDVELIKSVAGVRNDREDGSFRGLAVYADELQQTLADKIRGRDATIWIEEILGTDLKEVESAEEFLVGLNREMIAVILPLAKSRQEVLFRACTSKAATPKALLHSFRRRGGGVAGVLSPATSSRERRLTALPALAGC